MAHGSVSLPPPSGDQIVRTIGLRKSVLQDFYPFLLRRTWPQIFGLAAGAFIVANLGFAVLYTLAPGSIANARPGNFEDAFYFSVETMATIGYGAMSPATRFAHCLVLVQALVGIFSTALITGITFSKFSRPTSRVLFSDKFVRLIRNGVPHIVFRMANARHNQVVEAQVRIMLLAPEVTREGEKTRRAIDLPLVRDRTPLFALSFMAMHRIDGDSPFRSDAAIAELAAAGTFVIIMLSGLDQTFGQTIHARRVYRMSDLVVDARFEDVLTPHDDGSYTMDYTHFNEVVPIPAGDSDRPRASS